MLEDALGPGQLERLHRLTETGPVRTCLAEELADMESLFFGAHVIVSKELGLAPDPVCGFRGFREQSGRQICQLGSPAELGR